MNEPFCIAPWISIQYGNLLLHSGASPCCEWSVSPDNNVIFSGPLNEYNTSEWLNDVREYMLSHDMNRIKKSCENCLMLEEFNLNSKRLQLKEWYMDDYINNKGFVFLDYRPNNICNLKCRMCFPSNSSMIAKEQDITFDFKDTSDVYSIDFTNIKHISIVGGEPSIANDVYDFLKYLVDNAYAKNILLNITTNATNAKNEWINILKQFKKCTAIVSLDGAGPVYNYIRTNADWNYIVKNVYEYIRHFPVHIQVTGSMYNIPVIDEWLPELLSIDTTINLFPVEGHKALFLSALPDDIRFEKMKYLETVDHNVAAVAYQMLKDTAFNKDTHQKFINYTNKLDAIRKTDIKKISPVFKRIMEYNVE